MRIASWNIWSGSMGIGVHHDLKRIIEYGASIIALQEVHHAGCTSIPEFLTPLDPGSRKGPINTRFLIELYKHYGEMFNIHFAPQLVGCTHDCERSPHAKLQYGNVMMVRRSLEYRYRDGFIAGDANKLYCFETGTPAGKTGQAVTIRLPTGPLKIGHGHGAWANGHKGDVPWRTEQANKLLTLLSQDNGFGDMGTVSQAVLVGDLNVRTDTEKVRQIKRSLVFGPAGAEHLNAKCNIWDTRTHHYAKEEREADHAFASPSLDGRLELMPDVHSDHAVLLVTVKT